MWWSDGSRSENGQVGSAEVWKQGTEWKTCHSYMGTGRMAVCNAELWVIGLPLRETVKRRDMLQEHGVKTVAVFSHSYATIRGTEHLEPGLAHRLARQMNWTARALLTHSIPTEIHWVPGDSGIVGNKDADHQANLARDSDRSTPIEPPYTSASNRGRQSAEEWSAATAEWEADKCSKHTSHRLKSKTGDQQTSSDDQCKVASNQVP
jgi:hypothetical protein